MSIKDIRTQLDPCKQYMHCEMKHLVIAMGQLPKCIDLNYPANLISQVMTACGIMDPTHHIFLPEVNKDGTWASELTCELRYAFAVMSRVVAGDYQAIYFYADGTIIVIDKWHNYLFHMDG